MEKTVPLFDCDGTLVDSTRIYERTAREVGAKHGISFTDAEMARFSGIAPSVWLKEKGIVEPKAVEAFRLDYGNRARELLPESVWFPGAKEMLEIIVAEGFPCAIITTARIKSFTVINDALGITKLVPLVITGDQVEPNFKPEPDGLHMAMDILGVKAEDCFYGGDNDVDMYAAQRARVLAIHIAGAHTNPHVRGLADHVITHPMEFLRFLKRRA